jgi:gluconolactonase
MRVGADGRQTLIAPDTQRGSDSTPSKDSLTRGTLPNGFALANDGSFVVANLGLCRLERLDQSGRLTILLEEFEDKPLGQVNFVLRDNRNRFWVSISTRATDWMVAMRPDVADGYIGLYEEGRFRIVAEGFHYTNEIRLDAREEWLYVSETCGPYVTRMRVGPKGDLSDREIYGPTDHGGLLDGIAFDSYGNLWGTHVFSDRIFAITPKGDLRIVFDDGDANLSTALMKAFRDKTLVADQIMRTKGTVAPWITGITFGGADLRTVHIASVLGVRLPSFRSPVAGLPMQHWNQTGVVG